MSNDTKNQLLSVVQEVLQDYSSFCDVEVFDGNVIITDNMADAYIELRRDLVDNGKRDISDIQQFHGLAVQPIETNGIFTILLNKDYIVESENKGNVDWLGTVVHEAVHVNDFKSYFNLVRPDSFDELYDYDQHRMFLYWTEFHARAIGHYFLRKYTLTDFKSKVHLNNLMNYELPYQIEYMVKEVSATDDMDRQMYVIVHFFGRLAVWQHIYPDIFNSSFMEKLLGNNPWMKELYCFLIGYETVEEIYAYFDDMEDILNKHFCGNEP